LIGNKVDLEEARKVNKVDGEKFKNENDLNMFIESSAKTGYNAREIFIEATKLLYSQYLGYKEKRISIYSMSEVYKNLKLNSPKKNNKNNNEIEIEIPKSESRCC
jgi:hypothetical protein